MRVGEQMPHIFGGYLHSFAVTWIRYVVVRSVEKGAFGFRDKPYGLGEALFFVQEVAHYYVRREPVVVTHRRALGAMCLVQMKRVRIHSRISLGLIGFAYILRLT